MSLSWTRIPSFANWEVGYIIYMLLFIFNVHTYHFSLLLFSFHFIIFVTSQISEETFSEITLLSMLIGLYNYF